MRKHGLSGGQEMVAEARGALPGYLLRRPAKPRNRAKSLKSAKIASCQ
jgi:hypothetical protein